jgi:hypothetical protein
VSGTFGTVKAASRCRDKLRIFPVERHIFQDEQDVTLNPDLKLADWQRDALRLLICARPFFPEARVEGLLLLCGPKSRQQQGMTYADLVFGKGFNDSRRKFGLERSGSRALIQGFDLPSGFAARQSDCICGRVCSTFLAFSIRQLCCNPWWRRHSGSGVSVGRSRNYHPS